MLSRRINAAHWIALSGIGVIALMLLFPAQSLTAAVKGVGIWWDVLFPALFPFLVIAEVLLGFGIVHFFGALFDPMMRPLFRVPGIGGFVMAMGFASGYPVGARLTSQLWEQKLVSRSEGERLVSFTTTSDPIFLIGAVSVGFFGDAGLAPILTVAHYGAAVLTGLVMRFVGRDEPSAASPHDSGSGFLLIRALRAMHRARLADGRPFGTLLGQAVTNSLQMILVIGGLVVFFSVVIEVMTLAHVMNGLYAVVRSVFHLFAIRPDLSQAVVNGIFEVTLGAKAAGTAGSGVPLVSRVAIAALVLSWGGLSVHAQVVSLLHRTNLRYAPFVLARLLHALLACGLVFALWEPLQPLRGSTAAFVPVVDFSRPASVYGGLVWSSGLLLGAALCILIALFAVYVLARRIVDLFRAAAANGSHK